MTTPTNYVFLDGLLQGPQGADGAQGPQGPQGGGGGGDTVDTAGMVFVPNDEDSGNPPFFSVTVIGHCVEANAAEAGFVYSGAPQFALVGSTPKLTYTGPDCKALVRIVIAVSVATSSYRYGVGVSLSGDLVGADIQTFAFLSKGGQVYDNNGGAAVIHPMVVDRLVDLTSGATLDVALGGPAVTTVQTAAYTMAVQIVPGTATGPQGPQGASGASGLAHIDTLVLSASIVSAAASSTFTAIDAAAAGGYAMAGNAGSLFEHANFTGLDAHYTASDDLVVLARLTVTVLASGSSFTGALAIDVGGDVIGQTTTPSQQSQRIISTSDRTIMTCERIVTVNSGNAHIKGAFNGNGYGSDTSFERATLSLIY